MGAEYERRLAARARELADLADLRQDTLTCLGGARHAGLDPEAITGLVGCAATLGASSVQTYNAGHGWPHRHASERAFLDHIASIEDDIEEHLHAAARLARRAATALGQAREELNDAREDLASVRNDLAAAHAIAVQVPCDGCHGSRQAAIAAAQAAIAAAEEQIAECRERTAICEDVGLALIALRTRLARALLRVRAVPADLGETYESVYNLIRRGGRMPHEGRWITGDTPAST